MSECRRVKKILSRYLDKEAGEADTAFVEKHLDTCDRCNKEYSELFKVKQLMLAKERKSLPADYLVLRLKKEIASQEYAERIPSWLTGMGNLSRRLIPVPAAVIALSLVFLILSSRQELSASSLEEHILSGNQTTTETAARLILGVQD